MARLLWLPEVLRRAGIDLAVLPGAESRGRENITVNGIVWHHTVTGPTVSDARVAALLRDGRSDLAGPLCQVGIERDGTWVIIALGRANHNGYGMWGNDSLGLEFYNDGKGEAYSTAQYNSGITGTVAVLKHLGRRADAVKGHKETDPNRKIDPLLNMNSIRAAITSALGAQPIPGGNEVKDQIIFFDNGAGGNHAYRCSGLFGIHLKTGDEINALKIVGIPFGNDPAKPWPANVRAGFQLLDGPFKSTV